jgi:hypothetical protein
MEIKLKAGMGELLFGMQEKDVKDVYGEPDRKFKDDDKNNIFLYNDKKLRLTFYQDEDFRLGYIISSNPDLKLFGANVIGQKWEKVNGLLTEKNITSLEQETFDTVDNYFNEGNWVIFQVEFNEVTRIELGATINSKDEFDWKF